MLLYPFLNKSKIPIEFKSLKIINILYNKLYEKKNIVNYIIILK